MKLSMPCVSLLQKNSLYRFLPLPQQLICPATDKFSLDSSILGFSTTSTERLLPSCTPRGVKLRECYHLSSAVQDVLTSHPNSVHAASAFIRDGKTVPFTSIILVEPVFLSADVSNALLSRLVKPCAARKWQWKSREEAAQHVKKAFPWKSWHTDAAEVFLVSRFPLSFLYLYILIPS